MGVAVAMVMVMPVVMPSGCLGSRRLIKGLHRNGDLRHEWSPT